MLNRILLLLIIVLMSSCGGPSLDYEDFVDNPLSYKDQVIVFDNSGPSLGSGYYTTYRGESLHNQIKYGPSDFGIIWTNFREDIQILIDIPKGLDTKGFPNLKHGDRCIVSFKFNGDLYDHQELVSISRD